MLAFISLGTLFVISLIGASAATVYTAVTTQQAQKKAQKTAEKQWEQQFQRETEAGEYYEELTREQMELQSQSAQIKTLANMIESRRQPTQQQIITTPGATEYSAVDQINQAIGKLFGR